MLHFSPARLLDFLQAHKLKKHVCHGAGCAAFMGPRRPKFHEANEAEVAFDEAFVD